MLLELGPVAAGDLQRWSRRARRVVTELRSNPEQLDGIANEDWLDQWSKLIDAWCSACSATGGTGDVRWSCPLDDEMAEFLVHGLERCFHSDCVNALIEPEDRRAQGLVTLHIIQAFVDGLSAEGDVCHQHYVDQVRASLAGRLEA